MQASYNKSRGFTIVEVIVVILVLGLLLNVVFVTLSDYYLDSSRSIARTAKDSDTRSVLRSMEKDIVDGVSFSPIFPTTSSTVTAPLGSQNDSTAWNYIDNTHGPVLIVNKTAVTKSASNDSGGVRLPVFVKPSSGSCTDLSSATIAKNAYIYFIATDPTDGTKLNFYRRIIAPAAADVCGTQENTKTTCAVNTIAANPTICPAADALLLRDVLDFKVDYLDSSNGTIYPNMYVNDSTTQSTRYQNVTNARAIEITITSKPLPNVEKPSTATIHISLF